MSSRSGLIFDFQPTDLDGKYFSFGVTFNINKINNDTYDYYFQFNIIFWEINIGIRI